MASNEYHFITHWRVPGTVERVSVIIGEALELPRWWPSVYLGVRELAPGDPAGVGRRIDLYTRGWLPYTLRWQFVVTAADAPLGFTIEADGDFAGRGEWTFAQEGDHVAIRYDWRIAARKPCLRRLSWLLRPAFAANHRWAMAKGEESLRLELRRLAGEVAVPAPPVAPDWSPRGMLGRLPRPTALRRRTAA